MVYIEGSPDFLMGVAGSKGTPQYCRAVESFYVDPREFTLGDLEKHGMGKFGLLPGWEKTATEDHALPIRYDWAVARAEILGKRLPFEAEFEYAATRPDIQYASVDDSTGQFAAAAEASAVDLGAPRIYGLLSNLAEWTATSGFVRDPDGGKHRSPEWTALDYRLVRGGDSDVAEGDLAKSDRDPRFRWCVPRHEVKPGLGFRCVRSAQPRFFGDR
jgi:formylglycine-generating enzyme required for sulfatase activity